MPAKEEQTSGSSATKRFEGQSS